MAASDSVINETGVSESTDTDFPLCGTPFQACCYGPSTLEMASNLLVKYRADLNGMVAVRL